MKIPHLAVLLLASASIISGCVSSEPSSEDRTATASSFEQCAALGGDVMESDPMQCAIGGEVFVDETLLVTILKTKAEKDGYSLTVQDMAGKTYESVVSIANLGPDSTFDFDHIKVGNQLRLKGEFWDMGGVPQITASYAEYVKRHDVSPPPSCPIMDTKDLNLWINAEPNPDGPTLIAIFKGTAPTPGYGFKGRISKILKSDPPSYVIDIAAIPPAGIVAQVLTPTEVRLDIPVQSSEARSVTLTCAGQTLFTVDKVTTAW